MKIKIKSLKGTAKKDIELPKQFNEPIRPDLIRRVFLAFQSHNFQPYGAFPEAGTRASAYLSKRRHSYKSTYGIGWSRTPRKIVSRRGTRINYVGAFAPQTVGGRRAHPPKAEKIIDHKINDKERRKGIRSALAATLDREILMGKNYATPEDYPFVIEDSFESMKKTKELAEAFELLKIEVSLEKKIRAGKGKLRGRKYTKKKGPLLVVGESSSLLKAAKNLNVEVVKVEDMNINLLAPGGEPGRIVLFTEKAVEKMKNENLFFDAKQKNAEKKISSKKSEKTATRKVE